MPDSIHELKIGLPINKDAAQQPHVDKATRKLYADASPSIVKIDIDNGSGSGFFINNKGQIATDAHVVEGTAHVTVITATGEKLSARIVALDDIDDLAIIEVDQKSPKGTRPLELGSSKLDADQPVWALGHPDGEDDIYVSPGYYRHPEDINAFIARSGPDAVKKADKEMDELTPLEQSDARKYLSRDVLSAKVNTIPGNSGGPLLDNNGKVTGISDISDGVSNSEFTPVEKLIDLINEKHPKFKFSYAKTGDGWTLTDIVRTDGTLRGPYDDHLAIGNIYRGSKKAKDTAREPSSAVH